MKICYKYWLTLLHKQCIFLLAIDTGKDIVAWWCYITFIKQLIINIGLVRWLVYLSVCLTKHLSMWPKASVENSSGSLSRPQRHNLPDWASVGPLRTAYQNSIKQQNQVSGKELKHKICFSELLLTSWIQNGQLFLPLNRNQTNIWNTLICDFFL